MQQHKVLGPLQLISSLPFSSLSLSQCLSFSRSSESLCNSYNRYGTTTLKVSPPKDKEDTKQEASCIQISPKLTSQSLWKLNQMVICCLHRSLLNKKLLHSLLWLSKWWQIAETIFWVWACTVCISISNGILPKKKIQMFWFKNTGFETKKKKIHLGLLSKNPKLKTRK